MTKLNQEFEAVSADRMIEPLLHERCTFGYYDEHGDRIGALGYACYLENITVLRHVGTDAVAADLHKLHPKKLYFGGEDVEARWIAPAKDGSPRFLIRHGYDYYFGGDDIDGA